MSNMKSVILLVALAMLGSSRTTAQTPNCIGVSNGYMFGNPLVPNQFYLCDGNVPIPMMCPSNMVFCSIGNIQGCLTSCAYLTMTTLCTETTVPGIPVIPTAPTASYPGQQPVTVNIPTAPTPAPISVDQCSRLSEGIISPISGSCSGYTMCLNGKTVIGTCTGNMMFNAATGTCSETVCTW